ncbi:MAG: hypothetical protein K2X08_02440, partial [Chlamydiales bacterium]|nr:hypothetical protein [Chlamydiales bacterium]
MISVRRVREPKNFDENVRQPGKNQPISNSRPRDLWTPFRPALAKGFKERCAYSAIEIYGGTVDHFLSFRHHPNLTYEWSNYRYCLGSINSRKRNLDELILDPYEVKDGWFEIKIPGYLLKPTNKIPLKYAFLASETIRLLKLNGQDLID